MVRTMPGQQETSPERERGVILPVDQHMLSFDVEEYFQAESAAADVGPERWDAYPKRLLPPLERILELLAEQGQRATTWAFDVLAEAGFRYDSSVFPIRHDRYGVPGAPRFIHRARGPAGGTLIEVPPLTLRLGSVNWPVGGGGYLRLLPVRVVAAALRQAERAGRPGMLYLHPWELDPDQPVLPMGRLGRWRHRVGLRRTADKLSWLLARFRFSAAAPRLDAAAGQAVETYAY